MIKRSQSILFALWLLLLPLPLFFPIYRLDYEYYYYQFSSFSFYPHFALALLMLFIGWRFIQWPSLLQPIGLSVPLLCLTVITAISILYASVDDRLATIVLLRLVIALLLYFVLQSSWLSQSQIYRTFLLFLAVQGSAATLQFWLQDDLGLSWLGELDLAPEPGRGSIIFGQDEYWLRSYGLAPHPNILGGFVGASLLIVFFGRQHIQLQQGAWLAHPAIFLGTLGLCFTFSRSAWLGTATGLSFGLGLSLLVTIFNPLQHFPEHHNFSSKLKELIQSNVRSLFPVLLAIIVFVSAARGPLQARSQPQANEAVTQSVGERQILISVAYDLIRESFPWGIGAGNFGPAMLIHPDKESFPNIHPVHNVPLLLTAELGLVGGGIWIWLMLFPAAYGLFAWWRGTLSAWLIGLTGALLVLAVTDLFDYYSWGWPHGLTWRWMLFALFANACLHPQSSISEQAS